MTYCNLSKRLVLLAVLFLTFAWGPASEYYTVDLSSYFNNDGISWDHNRADGNFDSIGDYSPGTFNYAAEELPESLSFITCFGITFQFPDKADGKLNNLLCKGQEIIIPSGVYSGIYVLGSAVNGNYKEPLIIKYQDQSVQTTRLALSDWCVEAKFEELPAITAKFRQMKTGDREITLNHIWLQKLSFDTSKPIYSIQLPDNQGQHIFALTLGQGVIPDWSKYQTQSKKQAQDSLSLELLSGNHGNIFYAGESAKLNIQVTHLPDTIKTFYLAWAWKDISGKTLRNDSQLLGRHLSGGFIFPVTLKPPAEGWYQMDIQLKRTPQAKPFAERISGLLWLESRDTIKTIIQSGIGTNESFVNLPDTQSQIVGELANQAGISWFRQGFDWGRIQYQPNEWDWKKYDLAVERAKAYHLQTLGLLAYWAGWSKPYTDEGYKQYGEFVFQAVNRYKASVKYWEIWNEPNIFYWKGTPEQYTTLLKAAYLAVKKADPSCKIIACATAGTDATFIEKVMAAGGLDYMDGISVHPYRGAYPDENGLVEDLAIIQAMARKYSSSTSYALRNTPKELWLTELGWWTGTDASKGGVSETVQASALVRSYISGYIAGPADKLFWYCYVNPGSKENYGEDNFGVLYDDLSPKPSYLALMVMSKELKGYSLSSTLTFDNHIRGYWFQKKGQSLLLVWKTRGQERVSIQTDSGPIQVTDMFGKTIRLDANTPLIITEQPLYITGDFIKLPVVKVLKPSNRNA